MGHGEDGEGDGEKSDWGIGHHSHLEPPRSLTNRASHRTPLSNNGAPSFHPGALHWWEWERVAIIVGRGARGGWPLPLSLSLSSPVLSSPPLHSAPLLSSSPLLSHWLSLFPSRGWRSSPLLLSCARPLLGLRGGHHPTTPLRPLLSVNPSPRPFSPSFPSGARFRPVTFLDFHSKRN